MRVVFAGTPDFAAVCLDALRSAEGIEVVGALSQPDRRAGRGMRLTPSPVKRLAQAAGIEVRTPARLKGDTATHAWLERLAPDALVVVAYGMILPPQILSIPRIAPVNVHASLLPRWRGAAPIERALLAGDEITGVCIMRMEEGLDTGPVYACEKTPILPDDTGASLRERLATIGARLLVATLPEIERGLSPVPQPETGVTYARKLANEERNIDWREPAWRVDRVVRCFAPKPGARVRVQGKWLKVLEGEVMPDMFGDAPGTVMAGNGFIVACGEGAYRLLTVQPEGRRAMSGADFLRGARLAPGTSLSKA
ncbi:MAG: methionyl-tRNA formyltransferase [Mariprofundaceae bacterium]